MTDTPDINDLITELRSWPNHAYGEGPLFFAAADALESLSADLNAALSRAEAAERELRMRELHHFEEEQARAAAEARVAELEAVVTEARAAIGTENAWDGHARADQLDNTRRILSAAPTDSLNRVRAEAAAQERARKKSEKSLDHTR